MLERIRDTLHYDLDSGWFIRTKALSHSTKVGERAASIVTPSRNRSSYRHIEFSDKDLGRRALHEHHIAWYFMVGEWPTFEIDHRDQDGLNNRWENLRPADASQQQLNSNLRSDNKTGVKGVWWDRAQNRFRAQISVNGKLIQLGGFPTIDEAIDVRRAAEAKHYDQEFWSSQ